MIVWKNRLQGLLVLPLAAVYWLLLPPSIRQVVLADLQQWSRWQHVGCNLWGFSWLMGCRPEFRSVFYKRARFLRLLSCWWLRGKTTLEISTNDIGGGLIIQHGFSTVISAEKMGRNCKVYQQVTIGFNHDLKAPLIGDNVEVCCGAKVIGGITIGDNVLIGANSVVVKDVKPGTKVFGNTARAIPDLQEEKHYGI